MHTSSLHVFFFLSVYLCGVYLCGCWGQREICVGPHVPPCLRQHLCGDFLTVQALGWQTWPATPDFEVSRDFNQGPHVCSSSSTHWASPWVTPCSFNRGRRHYPQLPHLGTALTPGRSICSLELWAPWPACNQKSQHIRAALSSRLP